MAERTCCFISNSPGSPQCPNPAVVEVWGHRPYNHTDACLEHVEDLKEDDFSHLEPIRP